jgi:short-chain Z-isoprenyl diphosphate synthase
MTTDTPPLVCTGPADTMPDGVNNPAHLAVILDGNRRWAERHGVPTAYAYRVGADRAVELAANCHTRGIRYLTVWALSQENLGRPEQQISPLVDAITGGLRAIAGQGHWRIRHLGRADLLPEAVRYELADLAEATEDLTPGVLNVAMAYSGRQDIAAAVRELVLDEQRLPEADRRLARADIMTLLTEHLATAGQPDPDLVVRTSGEQRLSGFMPWQAAYSELYFTPVDWPDFTAAHLDRALESFHSRHRRNGK